MRFCSRLTRKGEIPAEANGVHPTTTTRAQMYKEVTIAQVMRTKLSHGSNFNICLGPKPDTVPPFIFLSNIFK